jgi:hypothetical protein
MEKEARQKAARVLWQTIKALEDGAVTPEEGRYLALAASELLQKLAGNATKIWAKMAIEGAAVLCRNLAQELKEMENGN